MSHATAQHHEEHSIAHPVPLWLLFAVFGALLVLTVITVAVASFDFGDLNIWVALGIAVIKVGLVALFFMHLRWDAPFNGVIMICSFLFVALFIGITILDSHEYAPNYVPPAPIVAH